MRKFKRQVRQQLYKETEVTCQMIASSLGTFSNHTYATNQGNCPVPATNLTTQNGITTDVPAQKLKISNDTDVEKLAKLIKAAGIFEPRKCVYILELENSTVKIGISQNFQQRARQIINSTGFISNARDIEKTCHEHFNYCRVDGEFFKTDFNSAVLELAKHAEILDFTYIV